MRRRKEERSKQVYVWGGNPSSWYHQIRDSDTELGNSHSQLRDIHV